jgi:hypothetical protein
MRRSIILGAMMMFAFSVSAQWSTSTRAESTLYVCPGFYPGIVTFNDGSSIVLGALQSYIFARRLDEYGHYQWTPPVQVLYNDSSYITDVLNPSLGDWGGWVSDGDGGVILFWYDHRGAYRDEFSGHWFNNAIYAQRVDRLGNALWTPGGVKVQGPETGLKQGGIVNDGLGGCIVGWIEREFDFPGSRNVERAIIKRVSQNGVQMWVNTIDTSSIAFSLPYGTPVRALDRILIPSSGVTRVYAMDGTPITFPSFGPSHWLIAERDSVLFNAIVSPPDIIQRKLTATFDTLWTALSTGGAGSSTLLYNPAVPDGVGGVYYLRSRIDTSIYVRIRRVDGRGEVWPSELIVRGTDIPTGGFEGHGGILIGDWAGRVWRYDSLGQPVWQNPVQMLTNPGDTYFENLAADNRGGMIAVFWHTLGGIFAHHSGRSGVVGIITSVDSPPPLLPGEVVLYQNYPNPFNPAATIIFHLARRASVTLRVYDVLGRTVQTLVDQVMDHGTHKAVLDGAQLASGVYFYRLTFEGRTFTRKAVLMR